MAHYRSRFGDDDDDAGFGTNNRSRNPFDDEEEEEESEFLRLRREKELLEQRMIDSSYRSVNMVHESQQIASETGEDLKVQREKLERTNKTLDAMQDDLNESDRNITSLKSLWGTMSTWFKKPLARSTPPSSDSSSPKETPKGVSDEFKDNNDDIQRNLKKLDNIESPYSSRSARSTQSFGAPVNNTDAIVDKNLDQMLAGLSVLKTQGLALGSEIESQNVLLDTIASKVEKTDARVTTQEGKVRKILKK